MTQPNILTAQTVVFRHTLSNSKVSHKPRIRTPTPGFHLYFYKSQLHYPAKSGILQSPSCVCLFVCLFVSRICHKLLVGFRWNLVSREVMIIGRPSSNLGVIRIEIRIWDPDNCFPWTTGRILVVGKYSQSFSAVVVHTYIQLIPTMTCEKVDEWYICESREMQIVGSIPGDKRQLFNFFCYCSDPRDNYEISFSPGIQPTIFISGVSRLYHCCTLPQPEQRNGRL